MALAAATGGRLGPGTRTRPPQEHVVALEEFAAGRIPREEIGSLRESCEARGVSLHDAVMDRCGWPAIPYDGRLLVTQQDALLLGGKVQAAPGYADHVVLRDPALCRRCAARLCVEACSGEALSPGADGVPRFDRDKCIHCGACLWNCVQLVGTAGATNVDFRAGAGGLHSSEN
jgi:electron-transferring-flavoprotein dehydrogenase